MLTLALPERGGEPVENERERLQITPFLDKLHRCWNMEGAHLDESSCTAVALAVSENLNGSPIDAELLEGDRDVRI